MTIALASLLGGALTMAGCGADDGTSQGTGGPDAPSATNTGHGTGEGGAPPSTCLDDPAICDDPALPACSPSGACVTCTPDDKDLCQNPTPACNPASFACQPCAYHAECPQSACNVFTGTCIEVTPVTVGPDAGDDYATLAEALAQTGDEGVIRVKPGTYAGPFTVTDKVVAIVAESGRPVLTSPNPNFPRTLRVLDEATVLLEGITLTDDESTAITPWPSSPPATSPSTGSKCAIPRARASVWALPPSCAFATASWWPKLETATPARSRPEAQTSTSASSTPPSQAPPASPAPRA
ncbi:MAG: hypothetical protein AAGA56_10310 [Myxococcota bacterium]